MTTIMFRRGKHCLVGEVILTVLEPLGNSRQVVFFCRDKAKKRYRVPKSEVISMTTNKPKKGKKKRKCA